MITFELPFPNKALSPNGRAHRMEKAREAKKARKWAWVASLAALGRNRWSHEGATIIWTVHLKTANPMDDDNATSMLKAYRDGIADALGVNDRMFKASVQFAEPVKGGKVVVTISPL